MKRSGVILGLALALGSMVLKGLCDSKGGEVGGKGLADRSVAHDAEHIALGKKDKVGLSVDGGGWRKRLSRRPCSYLTK